LEDGKVLDAVRTALNGIMMSTYNFLDCSRGLKGFLVGLDFAELVIKVLFLIFAGLESFVGLLRNEPFSI
jgi:hypothetical protein